MKILHLITGLEYGGAETMLLNLVRQFRNDDVENIVISLTTIGPVGKQIQSDGITVHSLEMAKGQISIKGFVKLSRILRNSQPDILQTWLYHADLVGALTKLLGNKAPLVWGMHHTAYSIKLLKPSTRLVVRINRFIANILPDIIICCSKSVYHSHISLGYPVLKMRIIENGVDPVRFKPDKESYLKMRRQFDLNENTTLIGFCGRFIPSKRHDNFIKTAGKLHHAYPDIHFIMCGQEIDRNNTVLMEWIAESGLDKKTHLMGPLADLEKILQSLDIFVSPSTDEALPLSIAEAMACGVPCIVTDVGDQKQLIGDSGIVVSPNSVSQLVDACTDIIRMSEIKKKTLGQSARQRILENYSLADTAIQYLETYEQLIHQND